MVNMERSRSIQEHLARSAGNFKFERTPQNYSQSDSTADVRQKNIQEHLARSLSKFNNGSYSPKDRKQQIMAHVNITKG